MRTGEGDIDSLGEIVTWNNKTRTEAYEGECGRLSGSSEGLFPPGLADIKDSLTFYSTDLCRPLHFTKSGLSSIHGIPVTTFHLDPTNFANTTHCPGNICYNNNLPTGVQVLFCIIKALKYCIGNSEQNYNLFLDYSNGFIDCMLSEKSFNYLL